jgi:hypothetical protein
MLRKSLFRMGNICATPGALELLQADGQLAALLLARHQGGDFGDICAEDRGTNAEAVRLGGRILSAYKLPGAGTVWIITEADRTLTTILLPEEY